MLGVGDWGLGELEGFDFETQSPGGKFQFPPQRPEPGTRHQWLAMKIRACGSDDLASIYAIQLKCLQAAQWRLEDYRQLLYDPLGLILVATIEDANPSRVAGFAALHRVMDEAELRNMAVDLEDQRTGIARALLAEGCRILKTQGVARLFLEVRASNQPAIGLYRSTGFKLMNTRRDYYHDPDEDALVMACMVSVNPSASPRAS